MTVDRCEEWALLSLQLILVGAVEPQLPREINWSELALIARRNRVLIRLANQLESLGQDPPTDFHQTVDEVRSRTAETMRLIKAVEEVFVRHAIPHVFLKPLQLSPDLGNDVDVLVSGGSWHAGNVIERTLSASPKKRSVTDRLAGRASYSVLGFLSPLDLHHGRLGVVGELPDIAQILLGRCAKAVVDGQGYPTPGPEEYIVLQAIQRIYGHLSIRLSDVVATASIASGEVNWETAAALADQAGALPALSCYLGQVDEIVRRASGAGVLPEGVVSRLGTHRWKSARYVRPFYHLSSSGCGAPLYLRKLFTHIVRRDLAAASKFSLVPLAALEALAGKGNRSIRRRRSPAGAVREQTQVVN